jgi:thiamine biosynthesis lipoprotein
MTTARFAPHPTTRIEQVWGTVISIDVRDPIEDAVLDRLVEWFHRVDDLFSTWRDDSEISRLGRGELTLGDASPEIRLVLALCDDVTERSRGAFDIRFGADPRVEGRPGLGPIDPSGLVKGWALDRAAAMLREVGAHRFSINAGGDVVTSGRPAPDAEWRVGIQHPWSRQQVAEVVVGTDLVIATSGAYERGDHIVNPRTACPARGLASVTVVSDRLPLAIADAYATAAVVLSDEGMPWLAEQDDVEAMAITDDREVILTPGFDRYRLRSPD